MKLLELFKGTGSIGKVGEKYFDNIVSLDIEDKSKATITIDILKWDYVKFYKETKFIPDFIWASPPCNTFSKIVYPLRERHPHTAEPQSERALLGTKILYRTLEIIAFFMKLNPNLKYVIENPKGMMRNDKYMKHLYRETTYYAYYGDKRLKPTDFFSNFILNLKPIGKIPNKKLVGIQDIKLNDRYKIPAKLAKHIFDEFIKLD